MARGAARACALVACAIGALASVGAASAQTHPRTVAQAERDRRAANAQATRLRAQETAARRDLAALDQRLVDAGKRRADAEAAADAAQIHLAALQAQMDAEDTQRVHARDAFESALITAAFAQRRIELSAVRAGMFARAAAPGFRKSEHLAMAALARDRATESTIQNERSALADAQAAIDAERAQIVTLTAQRQAAAVTLASNAAAAEARARQYASEAQTLRQLAARVQRPSRRSGGGPAAPAIIPAGWQTPAVGRIVHAFGTRDSGGPVSQGVALRTRAGAQVVAPATGEVAYAGLFRSYGKVLILNVDGGYVVVLTGLDTINARVGDTVRVGQPIGEMPSSDTSAPELYVEVRRDGRPIDPGRWLTAAADRNVRDG
ncbi:MAG: peptidoglycan DD-metalloendopeptidase family protein [Terricaulis sp.]